MIVLIFALALAAGAPTAGSPAAARSAPGTTSAGKPLPARQARLPLHPLKLRNDFAKPEEVVEYFVRRELHGASIGGMGDKERREFTLWKRTYPHELFFVAKGFNVGRASSTQVPNLVHVEVTYEVTDYRDLMGTSLPVTRGPMKRLFALQKDSAKRWRILMPFPKEAVPVLSQEFAADTPKARDKD